MDAVLWHEETNFNNMWIELGDLRILYSETELPINNSDMIIWIKKNNPKIYLHTVDFVLLLHNHQHAGEQADFDTYKMYINQKYWAIYPVGSNNVGNKLKL